MMTEVLANKLPKENHEVCFLANTCTKLHKDIRVPVEVICLTCCSVCCSCSRCTPCACLRVLKPSSVALTRWCSCVNTSLLARVFSRNCSSSLLSSRQTSSWRREVAFKSLCHLTSSSRRALFPLSTALSRPSICSIREELTSTSVELPGSLFRDARITSGSISTKADEFWEGRTVMPDWLAGMSRLGTDGVAGWGWESGRAGRRPPDLWDEKRTSRWMVKS